MADPTQPGPALLTGYEVLRECATEGQHSVYMLKHKTHAWLAVQYGEQRWERLDYLDAAHKLGECLLHQLQAAGELD